VLRPFLNPLCIGVMILFFFQIPHEAVIHHTLHYFADAACQSDGAVTRWIRLVFVTFWYRYNISKMPFRWEVTILPDIA